MTTPTQSVERGSLSARVLGRLDVRGEFVSQRQSRDLAAPIRSWFHTHPEEIAPENYFSAIFQRGGDGRIHCNLELVGQHHWSATESGPTLPHALKKALENALPSIELSDWENRSN